MRVLCAHRGARDAAALPAIAEGQMRKKQVWRYWCDFCGKAGLQKHAMAKHEQHCTLNPQRKCRVCELVGHGSCENLQALIAIMPDPSRFKKYDCGEYFSSDLTVAANAELKKLRDAAQDCPACLMSAIRLRGIPVPMVTDFNFTEEMKKIWEHVNAEHSAIIGYRDY
jgi:hypothetical protein